MSYSHDRRTQHIHVFRAGPSRQWFVAQAGRRISRHRLQTAAIRAGRREARRRHVELVTHDRNGRIRAKNSYGPESPRRDRSH